MSDSLNKHHTTPLMILLLLTSRSLSYNSYTFLQQLSQLEIETK